MTLTEETVETEQTRTTSGRRDPAIGALLGALIGAVVCWLMHLALATTR